MSSRLESLSAPRPRAGLSSRPRAGLSSSAFLDRSRDSSAPRPRGLSSSALRPRDGLSSSAFLDRSRDSSAPRPRGARALASSSRPRGLSSAARAPRPRGLSSSRSFRSRASRLSEKPPFLDSSGDLRPPRAVSAPRPRGSGRSRADRSRRLRGDSSRSSFRLFASSSLGGDSSLTLFFGFSGFGGGGGGFGRSVRFGRSGNILSTATSILASCMSANQGSFSFMTKRKALNFQTGSCLGWYSSSTSSAGSSASRHSWRCSFSVGICEANLRHFSSNGGSSSFRFFSRASLLACFRFRTSGKGGA